MDKGDLSNTMQVYCAEICLRVNTSIPIVSIPVHAQFAFRGRNVNDFWQTFVRVLCFDYVPGDVGYVSLLLFHFCGGKSGLEYYLSAIADVIFW